MRLYSSSILLVVAASGVVAQGVFPVGNTYWSIQVPQFFGSTKNTYSGRKGEGLDTSSNGETNANKEK